MFLSFLRNEGQIYIVYIDQGIANVGHFSLENVQVLRKLFIRFIVETCKSDTGEEKLQTAEAFNAGENERE